MSETTKLAVWHNSPIMSDNFVGKLNHSQKN